MDVVSEFISLYNKQYDYYLELARIGKSRLDRELGKKGIKAIVNYRAKRPDSLRDKLEKRKVSSLYRTVEDIFADILDLAGVRVSIYFPSERDLVDEVINEIFDVRNRNVYPKSPYKPHYSKRFSGYWANHYQVCLREDEETNKRFLNVVFEIQVASVLMHAWSEVEHDMVYKSLSGEISEEELAILDEINGLVISGEIALERLHKALSKRTKATQEFGGRYELTNFIVNSLDRSCIEKLKLGDVRLLRNFFKSISNMDVDTFSLFLQRVNPQTSETISDQLINMIIFDYYGENILSRSLQKYFDKILGGGKEGVEPFFKIWLLLERCLLLIASDKSLDKGLYLSPQFNLLLKKDYFTKDEIHDLKQIYNIRRDILHGSEIHSKDYISQITSRLKKYSYKAFKLIDDNVIREEMLIALSKIKSL